MPHAFNDRLRALAGGVLPTTAGKAFPVVGCVTLVRDVLFRLAPLLRWVVASHHAGVPLVQEGELEPIGWWICWRQEEDDTLKVCSGLPENTSACERQEVVLAVAAIPAVASAGISGDGSHIELVLTLDRGELSALDSWLVRWKCEAESMDW